MQPVAIPEISKRQGPYAKLLTLIALIACVHGIFAFVPSASIKVVANDVIMIVTSAIAMCFAGFVAIHTRREDPSLSRAWFWIGLAYASTTIGNVIWAYLELVVRRNPVFSAADTGYLGFYVFYTIGVISLTRRPLDRTEWQRLLAETILVMVSGGTLWYALIVLPSIPEGSSFLTQSLVANIYPLLDMLAIWLTLMMLIRDTETSRRRALIMLLVALATATVSDTAYAILITVSEYSGNIAVEWMLGASALLAALAASIQWRDRALGHVEFRPIGQKHRATALWSRLTFGAPSLLICATLLYFYMQQAFIIQSGHEHSELVFAHEQIDVLSLGATVALGLILPRMILSIREQFLLTSQFNRLLETTRSMLGPLSTPELQQALMHQIGGLVNFDHVYIALARDDTFDVTPYDQFYKAQIVSVKSAECPVLTAAIERESIVFLDAGHTAGVGPMLAAATRHLPHAALVVPLKTNDTCIGVLVLARESDAFSEDEGRIAISFAQLAASAIESRRMREQESRAAALNERSRLARELHDSVSQALFGIFMGATTAREQSRLQLPVGDSMDYVIKLTEGALAEMRALVLELRPESLAVEGLVFAIEQQANALTKRHGIQTAVHAPHSEPPLTIEGKEALYRIGMEAIQNAIKHARCSRIDITLDTQPDAVLLEIRDNGVGFDTGMRRIGHFGLSTMRERAEAHGGEVRMQSAPGEGTRVQATIPLRIKIDQASPAGSGLRV